jgi:hypothetical protein
MRRLLFVTLLVMILVVATPTDRTASAQLRTDALSTQASVKLYDQGGAGFSLNRFFDPQHFRMSHSFELSSSSFGGYGSTLGMYTNSMMWQFSSRLAARVDLSMAYSPTAAMPGASMTGGGDTRVFLRNAEISFRPKENMLLHFSVRQNPYGYYASPYGYYGYDRGGMDGFDAYGSRSWDGRLR